MSTLRLGVCTLCFAAVIVVSMPPAPSVDAQPPSQPPVRVVHVFVALADNAHQGIVPVPAKLGQGDNPAANLYWGAAFGVKSYFRASPGWKLVFDGRPPNPNILERCIFQSPDRNVFLVADAYRGENIREAIVDFLYAAAGFHAARAAFQLDKAETSIPTNGAADLVAYVGHDAFMDFQITPIRAVPVSRPRPVIILACDSKDYFGPYLTYTNADPLLWTTGLMAPEAYTLRAAIEGWIAGESPEQIRMRAAAAYDKYQHCGSRAAQRLFASAK